jgi:acetyl-CoA carboxylase biotin carboxyl carrier protein
MEIEFVNRLIDLVERSALSELEYSENGNRLRVVKAQPEQAQRPATGTELGDAAGSPAVVPGRRELVSVSDAPETHTIASPLAGVFYRAPAENQPELVKVGDLVDEGQPLAIVEAMKMLNSIDADKAGRLAAVLVESGAEVEAGTALFVIEPKRDEDV